MTLSPEDIKTIVTALQESRWTQAEVVVGDVRIAVARDGAALPGAAGAPLPTPAPTPPAQAAAAPPEPAAPAPADPAVLTPAPATPQPPAPVPDSGDHVVASPTVGVFWRSPEPGADPFVEVGSTVAVGDTLGIVEVMKLMSNVLAEVAGTVVAVHVANAQGVEFGTPLVSIRPSA